MRALHPEILAKSYTYKAQVRTLQALNRMGMPALWQAIRKDLPQARHWIQLHFMNGGLPLPGDWTHALGTLKEAAKKGRLDLEVAWSALKTKASQQKAEELANRLWARRESDGNGNGNGSTKPESGLALSNP